MTENEWGLIKLANGAQRREHVTGQAADLTSNCNSGLTAGHWAGDLILLSFVFTVCKTGIMLFSGL